MGGFPSRASLLLPLRDHVVQVVRVNLPAVCECDSVLGRWAGVRFGLVACFLLRVMVFYANCLGSGGRVSFFWRTEGGRIVEVAVRAAHD